MLTLARVERPPLSNILQSLEKAFDLWESMLDTSLQSIRNAISEN